MAATGLAAGQTLFRLRASAALAVTLAAAGAVAANEESVAPYVPTVEQDVELMLDVAQAGPGDYVIDLGSGDGRIVIAAARRGAIGHGVEIDPELVRQARHNAAEAGVAGRTAFFEGDVFAADIARASVVTLYLFPEANIELRPKLLAELAPGTRVVSNSFDMGRWAPDVHDRSARSSGGVLMWIVPADVAGDWALETESGADAAGPPGSDARDACVLRLAQTWQQVDARFTGCPDRAATAAAPLASGKPVTASLHGERFTFEAEIDGRRHVFVGRVDGDAMHGYAHMAGTQGKRLLRWRARRR